MRALALLLPLLLLGAAAPPDQRSFLVSRFERLRVDGPFEVEVVRDGSPRASAEGERRALTRLAVRVEGSTLIVSGGPEGWNMRGGERVETPRIRIGAPDLRAIAINGGGRVRVSGMEAARIDLSVNGAGTLDVSGVETSDLNAILTGTGAISLGGTAQRVRLRSNGAGSIDASGLMAGDATIVAESAGDTRIAARYNARIFALGGGTVSVGGTAECAVSGGGPVECAGKMVAAK
jgi:hypothetical protein